VGVTVSIPKKPAATFATGVGINVNTTKVTVSMKVPKSKVASGQVVKYILQLKPTKGTTVTKTVSVKPSSSITPVIIGKKGVSYSLIVTSVTKAGKKTIWNGPKVKIS
jgi:hypothetical protein